MTKPDLLAPKSTHGLHSMPNHFAYVALFSWPVIVFLLFRTLPRSAALIWSIIGGYLLLPYAVGVKVPMVPKFDKDLIPSLSAGILCLVTPETRTPLRHRRADPPQDSAASHTRRHKRAAPYASDAPQPAWRPQLGPLLFNLLLILLVITPFLTVLQNGSPVVAGPTVLPALRLYDAFSMISGNLTLVLPYFLGRRFLRAPQDQVLLLRILVFAGLFYTIPTLFELRMSPQLSRWIYGFLAQPFVMAARDGGFRPVVFLQQGLWLAIYLAMISIAAIAVWRHERARGRPSRWLLAGLYLAAVLALCHSLGALMILIALLPAAIILSTRGQMLLATAVAIGILTYPVLRGSGLVPVDSIYEFVKSSISAKRASSFYTRLHNEDQLLARANLKPLAGWGLWNRSRVYNKKGVDISITDGAWVIIIGASGWLGYVAIFGLLTSPILLLAFRRRKLGLDLASSGLCMVLAANLIDMIPNATLTPVTWLVAGALAGRYNFGAHNTKDFGDFRQRRTRRAGSVAEGSIGSISSSVKGEITSHSTAPRRRPR